MSVVELQFPLAVALFFRMEKGKSLLYQWPHERTTPKYYKLCIEKRKKNNTNDDDDDVDRENGSDKIGK